MLKFLIVFISLLMIIFGGIFAAVSYKDSEGVKNIRYKVGYSTFSIEDKIKVDKLIVKVNNISLLSLIVGFCLFIASFVL